MKKYKLKTHSGAKKRFKLTATGQVKAAQAGKSHFMRKWSADRNRRLRGTAILAECDAKNIRRFFLYKTKKVKRPNFNYDDILNSFFVENEGQSKIVEIVENNPVV